MFYAFYRQFELDGIIIAIFLAYILYILCGPKKKTTTSFSYILCNVLLFAFSYYGFYAILSIFYDFRTATAIHPYWYFFICMTGSAVVSSVLLLQGSPFVKLVYTLFFMSSIQLYKNICSPLYNLEGTIPAEIYTRLDLLTSILLFVLLFFLSRLFYKIRITSSLNFVPKKFYITLYFPISILLFYGLVTSGNTFFLAYSEPFLASMILSNLPFIYYLYASIIKAYEEQRTLDLALTQTKAQLSRFRFSIELEERLKKERHEIKNNYFYIQTLLAEEKYDELAHYLQEIIGERLESLGSISTGNTMMDYLLNKKIDLAHKYHIKTYTEVLVPEKLNVNDDLLCTILLNLLDNAIEASRKETNPDIHIAIRCTNGYLTCKISNKSQTNVLLENPNFITTKKDTKNHGLGMKIVKDAIKKANGMFHASMEENYFSVTVMLPLIEC